MTSVADARDAAAHKGGAPSDGVNMFHPCSTVREVAGDRATSLCVMSQRRIGLSYDTSPTQRKIC